MSFFVILFKSTKARCYLRLLIFFYRQTILVKVGNQYTLYICIFKNFLQNYFQCYLNLMM